MPPLLVQNASFDDPKNISKYAQLAETALGIHTFSLSYHDVKRLVTVDESDPDVDVGVLKDGCTDYLGNLLTEQVGSFCDTDMVKFGNSLGTLFKNDKAHRDLLPRIYLALDLRHASECVGALNTLRYPGPDESVSTEILTPQFIQKNNLPDFDESWVLCDLVCSKRSPTATLLVMSLFSTVTRGRARRPVGILAIAINDRSRKTFLRLGFNEQVFKSHGDKRFLMYAELEDIKMGKVVKRLHFDENTLLLQQICFRSGLSAKTADRVVGRC